MKVPFLCLVCSTTSILLSKWTLILKYFFLLIFLKPIVFVMVWLKKVRWTYFRKANADKRQYLTKLSEFDPEGPGRIGSMFSIFILDIIYAKLDINCTIFYYPFYWWGTGRSGLILSIFSPDSSVILILRCTRFGNWFRYLSMV